MHYDVLFVIAAAAPIGKRTTAAWMLRDAQVHAAPPPSRHPPPASA